MMSLLKVAWIFYFTCTFVFGQIRYTVPEEKDPGTYIGNVANDLSLDIKTLSLRQMQVVSSTEGHYFDVNPLTGRLLIKNRIDREQLCRANPVCLIHFEVMLENPTELRHVEVNILDINDNSPEFGEKEMTLNISETVALGSRFRVERAFDPDVGTNSVSVYHLSPNKHFVLKNSNPTDGSEFPELVLERALDREQEKTHLLTMTVYDGGYQQHSAVASIIINILDANDNPPVFSQSQYVVTLEENAPKGSLVIKLNATDLDEGTNAEIIYSFSASTTSKALGIFTLDSVTGAITLNGSVDFEEVSRYEMYLTAIDKGPYAEAAHCTVLVDITDVNDNTPEITVKSAKHSVPEDASLGTVIAFIIVGDKDSGPNGHVSCMISDGLPFQLKPSLNNYFSLITSDLLDRELVSQYNVSIWASDQGFPVRSAYTNLQIQVSDVNDNPPRFSETFHEVYITENNLPGTLAGKVTAEDADAGQNAQISYLFIGIPNKSQTSSTYFSVGAEDGAIYVLTSLDYEKEREYQFQIEARDAGVPQLSGTVTVKVFVVDANDNNPEILHPSPMKGSEVANRIPRSSSAGYLVAKVSAVDADIGHNAWLSYQLLKSNVPELFSISKYTGEIRTTRQFQGNDSSSYTLVIMVKDNGQPALSATAVLHLDMMDSSPDVLPNVNRHYNSQENMSDLNVYLIICLLSIVVLFFVIVSVTIALRCYNASDLDPRLNLCCRQEDTIGRGQQVSSSLQPHGHQTYVEVYGNSSLYKVGTYRTVPQELKDDFITIDFPGTNNSNACIQQFQQLCLICDDNVRPVSTSEVRVAICLLIRVFDHLCIIMCITQFHFTLELTL
ncbi:protocadherin gamma-C3-like [Protopterus annectens]|uniref:protocadherin gamma-C3-like n=1 Tax=Protopterus annectens TaxID=7888 RepID=UPI001CF95DC7|nr:protocadherin gamma-C3-like [Protopterus annectens]